MKKKKYIVFFSIPLKYISFTELTNSISRDRYTNIEMTLYMPIICIQLESSLLCTVVHAPCALETDVVIGLFRKY